MTDVVTLTMNPSIDLSVSVERVAPFQKLRTSDERRDPGGGGINVARVLERLGADVTAVYPSGGALGQLLRQLVDREGITEVTIPISGETREDVTVVERATGLQYRFVLPGPQLREHEWRACLGKFEALDPRTRFVVCSGSLPPGVPDDFYGRVVAAAKQAGRKIVIDSSGPSLRAALHEGIYSGQTEFERTEIAVRRTIAYPSRLDQSLPFAHRPTTSRNRRAHARRPRRAVGDRR